MPWKKQPQSEFWYELFITRSNIGVEEWKNNLVAIAQHIGTLKSWRLLLTLESNTIRYFVISTKDISSISNNIDGLVLRPIEFDHLTLPTNCPPERLIQYVSGGNILDLKEKYMVKRGKELTYVDLHMRFLNPEKVHTKAKFYFKSSTGNFTLSNKTLLVLPNNLIAINFENNPKYMRKSIPKFLKIEKAMHMLSGVDLDAIFEVDSFPYFTSNHYLSLPNYDFDRHSFIIGASGSGKSKLISLFIDRLSNPIMRQKYRVIVVDPHATLHNDLAHIPDTGLVDFGKHDSTDLFPGVGTDLSAATELTATLVKSLLAEQYNARLDRLLRFSLFVLMTAQAMSLENLRRFLSDIEYRNQIVSHVDGYVPQNISKFFGADFNELRTQFYNETILPIVSLVDEMQLQPSLVGGSEQSLAKTIQDNFLTVFSLNKVSMGEKVVKTVAGLLIQQIFLLAQAGIFHQKILLFIDEVSVVQNPTLSQILAEARKFNLTVILTQQYFGQVEKDLRDAIFANVMNYYAFKVSEEDARSLEGNLNMELPAEIVEEEHAKGVSETDLKIRMLTDLNTRECLVRVLSNGQVCPCIKTRTVDAPHHKISNARNLKQFKQKLPEKFEESKITRHAVNFSPEFMEKLVQKAQVMEPQISDANWASQAEYNNLMDILGAHSSSREIISKRKANR